MVKATKTLFLFFALMFCSAAFSGLTSVFAGEVRVDMYDLGAYTTTSQVAGVHPSISGTVSARGQCFRPYFNGANLTVVQFYCYQLSASGNVTCKIYGTEGLYGSTCVPNSTVFAASTPVSVAGWSGTEAIINFTFPSGYIFDSSQTYAVVLEGTSGDLTTAYIGMDGSAPVNHLGNTFYYSFSVWTPQTTYDVIFTIFGDGGDVVSFNIGTGDVYINDSSNTTIVEVGAGTSSNTTLTEQASNIFFGEFWFIPLLVIAVVCLVLVKMEKFAAVIVIPALLVLEGLYYQNNDANGSLVWAMLSSLLLMLFIAAIAVLQTKRHKRE